MNGPVCHNRAGGRSPLCPGFNAVIDSSGESPVLNADVLQGVRTLVDAFRLVNQSLELGTMLRAILDGVRRLIDYDAAGIYVIDRRTGRICASETRGYTLGVPPAGSPYEPTGIVGRVLASGRPILVDNVPTEPEHVEGRASARTEIIVPLVSSRGLIGALNVESDRPNAYGDLQLDLLMLFASGVAGAIESALLHAATLNQRRLEGELQVARRVMEELLPRRTPDLDGFEIAGVNEPSYEVGGDYYEFIDLGEDRYGIAVADVVGKGVAAALLVAAMRASLASLVGHELALRAIMRRANRFFYESVEEGRFVTLFYGVMDVRARQLIYVNAGHLPPILLRSAGDVVLLEEGGIPLGLFGEPRYVEGSVRLQAGDVLALYTDGITEALEADGVPAGRERLARLMAGAGSAGASEICRRILQEVRRRGRDTHPDDRTLVILKAT
jgi:phosphoserine phosphatase RsbU/P